MKKINVLIALGGLLSVGSIGCMDFVGQAIAREKIKDSMTESGETLISECTEIVDKSLKEQGCPTPFKNNVLKAVTNANTPMKVTFNILKDHGSVNNNFLEDNDSSSNTPDFNDNLAIENNNNSFNQKDFNHIDLSNISEPVAEIEKTSPGKAPKRKYTKKEIDPEIEAYIKAIRRSMNNTFKNIKNSDVLTREQKLAALANLKTSYTTSSSNTTRYINSKKKK